MPRMISRPMLTSAICNGVWIPPIVIHGPIGTTAIAVSATVNERIGARRYKGLFANGGVMSSLKINFKPSASGCQMPNGPTRDGPQRFCMCATTLRSAKRRVGHAREQNEHRNHDLDQRYEDVGSNPH